MSPRKDPDALFDDPSNPAGPGPVYQGVCKQIRHLFPRGDEKAQARKAGLEGSIAQARSIAASIDRISGHGGGYQANGVPLATMHAQLDTILDKLAGTNKSDPFQELLDELAGNDPVDLEGVPDAGGTA